MVKRTIATALWFFSVATAWNLVAMTTDLPSVVGFVLGAAAAGFVWLDPFHLIWPGARTAQDGLKARRTAPAKRLRSRN
ncbi:MAG TPA: hypothetical protein VJZ72_10200 [Candidatus Limnocylindrales bacterium]|nr:hypothetical protein [Candidatus Limnocylindrales bacterium]